MEGPKHYKPFLKPRLALGPWSSTPSLFSLSSAARPLSPRFTSFTLQTLFRRLLLLSGGVTQVPGAGGSPSLPSLSSSVQASPSLQSGVSATLKHPTTLQDSPSNSPSPLHIFPRIYMGLSSVFPAMTGFLSCFSHPASHLSAGPLVLVPPFCPVCPSHDSTSIPPSLHPTHLSLPMSVALRCRPRLYFCLSRIRSSVPGDWPSFQPGPRSPSLPGLGECIPVPFLQPGNSSLSHFLYFEPIPAESRK